MNIKINNARELAHRAIDTINDGGNWRGAALLITKQAADGRTACAAVLATMLELWDRDMPAYNRAHFAEAVLTYAISGNSNPRRHKEWIRGFYWLRDGTDGVTADYAQLVTLRFCNTNVYAGLNAAYQLCGALYGRELEHSRITSENGERGVHNRLRLLVDAMIGKEQPDAPQTKPFTVWIADQVLGDKGYTERPFICHINVENAAAIVAEALTVYRRSFGLPAEGWLEFAAENGAYVFQVIAGHIPFECIVNNYDGVSEDDTKWIWGAK
jgi:hypothetical protein